MAEGPCLRLNQLIILRGYGLCVHHENYDTIYRCAIHFHFDQRSGRV